MSEASDDSSVAGPSRTLPNILITGTPGTGKTTHATLLTDPVSTPFGLRLLNVGDFVKDNECHEGWDEEWGSWIVDDDKLLDELEPIMSDPKGGVVLDWHSSEIFPERWLDLVIVLRCPHTILWDRLEKRGYPLKKIQENNDAEIMDCCLVEAKEAYEEEKVVELQSGGTGPSGAEEVEGNVARIKEWIEQWRKDNEVVDVEGRR